MIRQTLTHLCEKYGLQQTMLLFQIWYAVNQHGRIKKNEIAKLYDATLYWHQQIVKELMIVAKEIDQAKHPEALSLKHDIQETLHYSENIEQNFLTEALSFHKHSKRNRHQQLADASYNLFSYFKYEQVNLLSADQSTLCIILHAAFSDLSGPEIIAAIEHAIANQGVKQPHSFQQYSLENV